MPNLSKTLEFTNPYISKNSQTTKASVSMPQMVNGRRSPPSLTFYSDKIPGADWYKLGERSHTVSYTVEGAFKGTCTIQVSTTPNPTEVDWINLEETKKFYQGTETTGAAGIGGGFSGRVSRPTKTDSFNFTGEYAWIRLKLDISRGTLQAVKVNF